VRRTTRLSICIGQCTLQAAVWIVVNASGPAPQESLFDCCTQEWNVLPVKGSAMRQAWKANVHRCFRPMPTRMRKTS